MAKGPLTPGQRQKWHVADAKQAVRATATAQAAFKAAQEREYQELAKLWKRDGLSIRDLKKITGSSWSVQHLHRHMSRVLEQQSA